MSLGSDDLSCFERVKFLIFLLVSVAVMVVEVVALLTLNIHTPGQN